ncbi:putative transcriptional regulator [Gordonia terrae C-6]|uniref:Putative transcriptional regulator n=1 Tax=Gordonia terrae C-6 TaxID=1316928 RepID=R7Y3X7_9ACTN|nr:putative transcriptional regulator [Gordonia terrae C-6]
MTDHRQNREGGGEVLELAILGLLLESPMHGYELRKRLTGLLGAFRAFSYGSLYPTLRRMQADGLIDEPETPLGAKVRRGRRVYQLTDAGRERFAELVADTGPQNYTDDGFGVHLAFFSRTPAVARMRILEGRRRQVEERREGLREIVGRSNRAVDRYTRQLHQLSLESSEREVRWLNELIAAESSQQDGAPNPFDTQFDDDLADSERSQFDSGRPNASTGRADDEYQDPDSTPSRDEPEQLKTPVAQRTTAMPREEGEPDHG